MLSFAVMAVVLATMCGVPVPANNGESEKYFATFGGYALPLRPVQQLSRAEAEARETYVVARYEASGRLVEMRKLSRGAVFFRHEYVYDDRGTLVRAIVTNQDGRSSVLERSRDGRMLPRQ